MWKDELQHSGVRINLASDNYSSDRLIVELDLKFCSLNDKKKVTFDATFSLLREFLLERLGWVDIGFLDALIFCVDNNLVENLALRRKLMFVLGLLTNFITRRVVFVQHGQSFKCLTMIQPLDLRKNLPAAKLEKAAV